MNCCSVRSQKLCGRRLRMWEKGGKIKSAPFFLPPPPRTSEHIRSISRSFLISRLKPFLFLLSASLLIEHASWEEAEEQDVEAAKR